MMKPTLPAHLDQAYAQGLFPGHPVAQWELGMHKNFIYLLIDWTSKDCVWLDPQSDLDPVFSAMDAHGLRLAEIWLTHTHHDHVAGLPKLLREFPDLPIRVGQDDAHRLSPELKSSPRLRVLHGGETLVLGSLSVQALPTPGHSAGAISYFVPAQQSLGSCPPILFSGDTVFIRDCGRTDLPTGSDAQMFQTLQRLKFLPPETLLLPGHHYQKECASTLGAEFRQSPPFLCATEEELTALN